MPQKQIAYFSTKTRKSVPLKITSVIEDPDKVTFVAKKIPADVKAKDLRFSGFRDPLVRMDVTNIDYCVISETDHASR